MFPDLAFAPEVEVDLAGSNPPAAANARVTEELVLRTLKQDPN